MAIRLFKIAICLLLLALGCCADGAQTAKDAGCGADGVQTTVPTAASRIDRDRLTDGRQLHRERPMAVLTDAGEAHRVLTSRPQRLLSSQGDPSYRMQGKYGFLWKHVSRSRLSHPSDGRCRRERAPFSLRVSCDYYVIALRHILR